MSLKKGLHPCSFMYFWLKYKYVQRKNHGGHCFTYHKVASTSPSCLEAHAGFFRLSMKGKFDVYLL